MKCKYCKKEFRGYINENWYKWIESEFCSSDCNSAYIWSKFERTANRKCKNTKVYIAPKRDEKLWKKCWENIYAYLAEVSKRNQN